MLKKIKTDVTYRVPAWNNCNLVVSGTLTEPSREMCRFCVKEGKGYRCALYNISLDIENGTMPVKARACKKATARSSSTVEDTPEPSVDPKRIVKVAISGYNKMYKKLLNDGYPAALAEQLATEHMLGGK